MSEKIPGKIFLIPSTLGEGGDAAINESAKHVMNAIEFFIIENERSARRFLRSMGYIKNFDEVRMMKVEKDADFIGNDELLIHLEAGKAAGIISEAGCPGIADPGSAIVRWGHMYRIRVVPLPGPSSIILALMASGLSGQQFAFHGYLPVPSAERKIKIKQLEEESMRKKQTQIFMETPYRNDALLKDILDICKPSTRLCIATDITLPSEKILTLTISEWKKQLPVLNKKPTIFLMQA